jgi:alkylation response protein AidB-like acyl-CoA dehydrogenase/electron transfer flavoprotein alpha subunit
LISFHTQAESLAGSMLIKCQERARRTWSQQYAWAAADGRQVRWHHLVALERLVGAVSKADSQPPDAQANSLNGWRGAENRQFGGPDARQVVSALDRCLPESIWRQLESGAGLTEQQNGELLEIVATIPNIVPSDLPGTIHPPSRQALLSELGRRDPSLAFRAASHLLARDLLVLSQQHQPPESHRSPGIDTWLCVANLEIAPRRAGTQPEAWFVPVKDADLCVVIAKDRLTMVATNDPCLVVEHTASLGLRGAGLAIVRLAPEKVAVAQDAFEIKNADLSRAWEVIAGADLVSIAYGMADKLCERAIGHAASRVQFPGLFHDLESRDTIGKFGAVKKMLADMAARRYLIETLDNGLSGTDLSSRSTVLVCLVKSIVAEALGTSPGSISYNAGQIFGGTGYSEDDILSKFYRDAAAWRVLGVANSEVFASHGATLLHDWQPDGQNLATLPDEASAFEELSQRKALQAELDEIRNARSRLRSLTSEWVKACNSVQRTTGDDAEARAEIAESLGRQDAYLLASKALILRTHARMESGVPAEVQIALLRVWLDAAASSLDNFELLVRGRIARCSMWENRPIVEPSAEPAMTTYADYLSNEIPYDSGDFLVKRLDLTVPRFVPEMVAADPVLARRNQRFEDLLSSYFGAGRGGMSYERYVEKEHRPDDADLEFCRRHGFFRMPIPKELGGEGRPKVDYYLLTTNAQRLADVSISLSIQANTSIGTSPVLIARDKDLPKLERDVSGILNDSAFQERIHKSLNSFRPFRGDAKAFSDEITRLDGALEEKIFSKTSLKSLSRDFSKSWKAVRAHATESYDPSIEDKLTNAQNSFQKTIARLTEFKAEIRRRVKACELFLHWVSCGQISAFALTEPSAGSDTARVATRAVRRSVRVEPTANGTFEFIPFGNQQQRTLLDAERLEFRDRVACYRYSGEFPAAQIRFDDYDYETDRADGLRYFEKNGERIHFSDIAFLRKRDDTLWYDYWELTGAKMWITNGRICGVMALYAKTEEGVTGFIVDRHAEGLVVGKDEAKMGQCGSPTNELSLQAVRVPLENVLGLEGRGQVNALETLNVGRAGLATSAVVQMRGLIDSSCQYASEQFGGLPDAVAWRLERMREDQFIAAAVAYEVVGRFDHRLTRSVRMESAISKMLASELLHEVIELAEEIHGLPGQTQLHLVEKRKRDARILNIYEGTNEIQRFLIVKELASEVVSRCQDSASGKPKHSAREALEFEATRNSVCQKLASAVRIFDQDLWRDPNLQSNCFLLAEAVAWLKASDSTLARLAWLIQNDLSKQAPANCPDQCDLALGRRSFNRCLAEAQMRLRRFEEELTHLRRGYYGPDVRAASLLFHHTIQAKQISSIGISEIRRPLSLLVIVEPQEPFDPDPCVRNGRLVDPYPSITSADRSAVETALRIRDSAHAPVRIEVAGIGSRASIATLRELMAVGVDSARLVVSESAWVSPHDAAKALIKTLAGTKFDLILGGLQGDDAEEGVLTKLVATGMDQPFVGIGTDISIEHTGDKSQAYVIEEQLKVGPWAMPAAIGIQEARSLRPFTISSYLQGITRSVNIIPWPADVPQAPAELRRGEMSSKDEAPGPLTTLQPREAARRLLHEAELHGTPLARNCYQGTIESVSYPEFKNRGPGKMVLAILACESNCRLRPGSATVLGYAAAIAESLSLEVNTLVLGATDEEGWRRIANQVTEQGATNVILMEMDAPATSTTVMAKFLASSWHTINEPPTIVLGESWVEDAIVELARKRSQMMLRCHQISPSESDLVIDTRRAFGKLRPRYRIAPIRGSTIWLALSSQPDAPASTKLSPVSPRTRVQYWKPHLLGFYDREDIRTLLKELKETAAIERLADADFIVDVGFGVGNRDGYEAVVDPLLTALSRAGVRNVSVGGSRKATEELHLLPLDRQIGQSGISVNPKILLAIGVSGAPQHLNYIGPRATVIAFNRDAEAPIMVLNRHQARPKVFPVVGNLFETIPAFIAALKEEPEQPHPAVEALPPAQKTG